MPWISHIYIPLYNGVKIGVLHSLPHWNKTSLSVLKMEQKWVWPSHGILHHPCSLIRTKVFPLHLYLFYGLILRNCYFCFRMHIGSTWNYPFGSTWITFQSITWLWSWIYFLRMETWNIMRSHISRQWNPICNWSYYIKDFKRPRISRFQIGKKT